MRVKRLGATLGIGVLGFAFGPLLGAAPAFAAPGTPTGASAVRAPAAPDQIKVSWKSGSGVDHYTVELFDGITDTVSHVPANVTSLLVGAADPCARYQVRISARDASDQGGATGWMVVKSLAPGVAGGLVAVRGTDRATAVATWRAPAWPGYRPITGYRTQLVRQPDNTIVADQVVTDPTVSLTGVDRASRYTLLVTTLNEFGSCLVAKATVASDRPGVPRELVAERVAGSPTAVAATWQPPADLSAPPTYYLVNYSTPGKLTRTVRVDAPATSAKLTLDPALAWNLRVQSFNDIGGSPSLSNTVALPPATKPAPAGPDKTNPTITASATPAPNSRGWANAPVKITFSCADAQSGVASCSQPVMLTDDGEAQSVTGTATDKAGHTATRTATVNLDRTPPTITANLSPAPNAAGWNNGPVTVSFTCSDALSDIDVCPSPVKVTGDLVSRTVVTGTARDKAGNTATASATVNIDRTAPAIVADAPPANGNGWNNSAVTVTFTCTDALSTVGTCPAPATVSRDGAAQVVTGTANDKAGNTATATATVSVDKTAPIITAVTTPPNPAGWNNTDVTVAFTCADALSGTDTCSVPVALTADGTGQQVTGTGTDKAGNSATATATANVDKTAPTIAATVLGVNDSGWAAGAVTLHYTCADALSGIVACPADVVVGAEGANQTIVRSVDDKAGNTATATTVVNIDRSKPVITTVRAAANGAGWNNTPVTVSYTCADPLSGIASCSPPVTVTGDGAGQKVSGTAVDSAGNTATIDTTVNLDATDPIITATVTGTKNSAGWYRGKAIVHFTCADTLSGVQTCPADVTIDTAGAPNQAITGTASDKAGNTATATATINLDRTEPVITATVSGTRNAAGWYRGNVTVRYKCSDALSGIDLCPDSVTLTTEGAGQAVSQTATDKAGNTATATVTGINIDKTDPVVTPIGATKGATYTLDNAPAVACQTVDPLSGVATQATLTISRTARGGYTATCAGAADTADNTASTQKITYTVKPTPAALIALTNLYITTNAVANAKQVMTDLGTLLSAGKYCDFLTAVNKEASAKAPNLTSGQATELGYWTVILAPKC